MLLYAWMDIHTNKNIQKYTHIWTTTYCCMRNWVFLCFLFLIWLNFKSISASSTHGLNAVRKLKRQQETRMSQCKRTTNCLALHLQLKYKCPIKGSFHFSFVCTCTGGEGKKKAIFACNFRNCFKCNSSSYSRRIKNFWSYSWPTLFVY